MSESAGTTGNDSGAERPVRPGIFIITADKIVLAPEAAATTDDRRRRTANTALLFVVLVLLTIWFRLHVETWATESTLIGGTLTVWALLQIVVNAFGDAGVDTGELRKGLLNRRTTTWNLILALGVTLTLFIVTSSVYVKLGATDVKAVHVEVLDGAGRRLMEPLRVLKVSGRPLFGRPVNRVVRIEITEPKGYRRRTEVLYPGQPLTLTFPDAFSRRTLVRIFISHEVKDLVPSATEPDANATKLTLQVGAKPALAISPFPFGTAYVGISDRSLAESLIAADQASFEAARRAELAKVPYPAEEINRLAGLWTKTPAVVLAWDLWPGHKVKATIEASGTVVGTCTATVAENGIADCVIGRSS